jgi:hypothetical protein
VFTADDDKRESSVLDGISIVMLRERFCVIWKIKERIGEGNAGYGMREKGFDGECEGLVESAGICGED